MHSLVVICVYNFLHRLTDMMIMVVLVIMIVMIMSLTFLMKINSIKYNSVIHIYDLKIIKL